MPATTRPSNPMSSASFSRHRQLSTGSSRRPLQPHQALHIAKAHTRLPALGVKPTYWSPPRPQRRLTVPRPRLRPKFITHPSVTKHYLVPLAPHNLTQPRHLTARHYLTTSPTIKRHRGLPRQRSLNLFSPSVWET